MEVTQMFNSATFSNNLKKAISRLVFVAVLLPSVNAFAGETVQVRFQNENTKNLHVTKVYKSSSYSKSGSSKKVFKDDYGRLPRTVSQPRPTTTVWLGHKSLTTKAQRPKTTWLGKKNRSD
jgi:hypothetical protein